MMATMLPTATTAALPEGAVRVALARRWGAVGVDAGLGLGFTLIAAVVAVAWLLLRTRAGAVDVGAGDAAFAFALVLASVPAWLGLLAAGLIEDGATPGQRRAGLAIEGGRWERLARLAVHPLGAVGWLWLTVVAAIATVDGLAALFAAAAVIVLAGGVLSYALGLVRPGWPPLHDRIAGTRMVRR